MLLFPVRLTGRGVWGNHHNTYLRQSSTIRTIVDPDWDWNIFHSVTLYPPRPSVWVSTERYSVRKHIGEGDLTPVMSSERRVVTSYRFYYPIVKILIQCYKPQGRNVSPLWTTGTSSFVGTTLDGFGDPELPSNVNSRSFSVPGVSTVCSFA